MRNRIGLIIFALMIVGPGIAESIYRLVIGKLSTAELLGLAFLILVIFVAFAIGITKRDRPPERKPLRWLDRVVFGLMGGGLIYLAIVGDSNTQFFVGLLAMFVALIFWFVVFGFSVGSAFRRGSNEDKNVE
jgi:peptidoglycan/LPS O-acetylase OafA/YrhL